MYYYLIALLVLIIDQVTKRIIIHSFALGDTKQIIGDFFIITYHENQGAAFGILQNQRWFFIAITAIVVVGIIWYLQKMIKRHQKLLAFSLSLVLGGAMGNFINRVYNGKVVDFLQFHFTFKPIKLDYIFPIFNMADSAIVCGVILIFLDSMLTWNKERRGLHNNGA